MTRIFVGLLFGFGGSSVSAESLTKLLLKEGTAPLAAAARAGGDSVRGAILFSQQKVNCVKCHQSGADDLLGPDLNRLGAEATDEYLVESLLEPSKAIKKSHQMVKVLTDDGRAFTGRVLVETAGQIELLELEGRASLRRLPRASIERLEPSDVSGMPSDLADQLSDRQQFLDLVKYLMDLAATSSTARTESRTPGRAEVSNRVKGLALMDHYRCGRCHSGDLGNILEAPVAPNLVEAIGRIDRSYLLHFIDDPEGAKQGTSMPNVLAGIDPSTRELATRSILAYLQSRGEKRFVTSIADQAAVDRGKFTFHEVGCVACHAPRDGEVEELAQDQSIALGDLAAKYSIASLVDFLEHPHAVRPAGRMPDMALTHWEAVDLANYLVSDSTEDGSATASEEIDASSEAATETELQVGRAFYLSLGCANCHENGENENGASIRATKFSSMRLDRGCLSTDASRKVQYEFADSERALIHAALREVEEPIEARAKLHLAMQTLRCFHCHQRDGLGGVSSERDLYFHTENENLGPQGRIPPTLTNVGAKLKSKWMRQVLVQGRRIRPYVKTRMPLYGEANVEPMMTLFQDLDSLPVTAPISIGDPKEAKKTGTELVGRKGLNCVACHTFQQKPAQTMPAVDLTEMGERLQRDWFHRYMRSPQLLSPGTVMPSFWPGGRAIRAEILDGDADMQIETIWHYLQDGRQARQPPGLNIQPMELVAGDEAVMLRRSYRGVGKRGIGVGYPSDVNLVFDAEQLRLAMLWKGKFADPSGVWRGQGSGTVRPLSREVAQFAAGPDLDDRDAPWIVDDGRPPRHHFMGYQLDDMRRPAFKYRFDQVLVEDDSTDAADESSGQVTLNRVVRFDTTKRTKGLRFRVATGGRIEKVDDHTYRLDGKIRITIDDRHVSEIVELSEQEQLVVPLDLPAGTTELEIQYAW